MARFRSIRAEDIAEAVPGFVRAGRPRSQEGVITRVSSQQRVHRVPLAQDVEQRQVCF